MLAQMSRAKGFASDFEFGRAKVSSTGAAEIREPNSTVNTNAPKRSTGLKDRTRPAGDGVGKFMGGCMLATEDAGGRDFRTHIRNAV
jgi:hypothetical protein